MKSTSWGIYGMQKTHTQPFFNLIFALGMKWTTEFHFSAARMMKKHFFQRENRLIKSTQRNIYATCIHTHTFSLSLAYFFWEFSHNDKWYKIHQCQKILETVTLHFNTISLYELFLCTHSLSSNLVILFRGSACLNFSIKISFWEWEENN